MFRKPKSKASSLKRAGDAEHKDEGDADGQQLPASISQPHSNMGAALSFDQEEDDDVSDFRIRRKVPSMFISAEGKKKKGRKQLPDGNDSELRAGEERLASLTTPAIAGESKVPAKRGEVPGKHTNHQRCEAVEKPKPLGSTAPMMEIPDAKAVYEARKKRERMRLGEEFIPLDDTVRLKGAGKEGGSGQRDRLIREDDDNDLSDEEELGREAARFYSAKSLLTVEEEQRRVREAEFLRVEQGDESGGSAEENGGEEVDSDDELARWEREQIRKGVSLQRVAQMQEELEATSLRYAGHGSRQLPPELITLNRDGEEGEGDMEVDIDVEIMEGREAATIDTKVPKFPTAANVSTTLIAERIAGRLAEKRQQLSTDEYELARAANSLEENESTSRLLADSNPHIQEKYQMLQEMRMYARDLLECLDAKIQEIDSLEKEVFLMWSKRAERLAHRRRQDVQDEYEKCSVLSMGRQWLPASAEYSGREAEREARRSRRRREREKKAVAGHHEGLSSDDEETTSQQVVYTDSLASVASRAAGLFDGVLEEYFQVDKVANRFINWLAVDAASFRDAYVTLCLPKLLAPLVRLDMLDWTPLQRAEELTARPWYQRLLMAGMDNAGVDIETTEAVDLIPSVVEKVLLPMLASILREQWDPLSLKESENCASLLRRLIADYPSLKSSSKRVKELLEIIWKRFMAMADEETYVPVYSKESIENAATGCRAFLNRQYWKSIKLIRCILCFQGVLSDARLEELAMEHVVNRSTVMALQVSIITESAIIEKCLAVVETIPPRWLPPSRVDSYMPLANFLMRVISTHEGDEESRTLLRPIRKFAATIISA